MQKQGIVKSINISKEKGVPKTPVDCGELIENHGMLGDAHAGPGNRQVSLLAYESIQKMELTGVKGLCSGKFAENITSENIILHTFKIGTKLKIGSTLHVVTQIGKKCHDGCSIKQEIGKCIVPKEGIFTKVILGGKIKKGDKITIIS